MEKKKLWARPLLTILRRDVQENVLGACKGDSFNTGDQINFHDCSDDGAGSCIDCSAQTAS